MQGWYFAPENKRLRFGDDRKIELGKTHTIKGTPILCQHGLHASENIIDALGYAPSNIIYKVKLSHKIVQDQNKACAQRRTYLAGGVDISDILLLFARKCALDVIHLWEAPVIVERYLETGEENLRIEAADAAFKTCTAYAAAYTAYTAAYAAAYTAARAAAYTAYTAAYTAYTVAYTAARAAADAARAAAKEKQNQILTELVEQRLGL